MLSSPYLLGKIDAAWGAAAAALLTAIGTAGYTFMKAKPESTQLLVSAAKDVVVIQQDALEELRKGLAEAKREIAGLTKLTIKVDSLEAEVSHLRNENESLRRENTALRKRITQLEHGKE